MSTADAAAASTRASGDGKPVTPGTPVLEARGLVKTFGHVVGLAGVSLQLYPGEVLAIIGDNGAGKSTLIKCLSGALTLDEGEILMTGQRVVFKSPVDARLAGIETVYQTLAVAPALDIASNLYLGREIRDKGPLGKVFRNGLVLMGVNSVYQILITGILVIAAVSVDQLTHRRQRG